MLASRSHRRLRAPGTTGGSRSITRAGGRRVGGGAHPSWTRSPRCGIGGKSEMKKPCCYPQGPKSFSTEGAYISPCSTTTTPLDGVRWDRVVAVASRPAGHTDPQLTPHLHTRSSNVHHPLLTLARVHTFSNGTVSLKQRKRFTTFASHLPPTELNWKLTRKSSALLTMASLTSTGGRKLF